MQKILTGLSYGVWGSFWLLILCWVMPVLAVPSEGFNASQQQNSLTVDFLWDGTGDNNGPYTFDWDFGDGNSGSGKSVSHTYSQAGTYVVNLTIKNNTGTETITTTKSVTVSAPNQPPVAKDDSGSTLKNTPVWINVLSNDSDPDGDSFSITGLSSGTWGEIERSGVSDIKFTPPTGQTGSTNFSYTITDSQGNEKTANVYVTVYEPIYAVEDNVEVEEGKNIYINVLGNDGPQGTSFTITNVSSAARGLAEIQGSQIRYTPNENESGSDTFNYTIWASGSRTATGKVNVTIKPANETDPGTEPGTDPGSDIGSDEHSKDYAAVIDSPVNPASKPEPFEVREGKTVVLSGRGFHLGNVIKDPDLVWGQTEGETNLPLSKPLLVNNVSLQHTFVVPKGDYKSTESISDHVDAKFRLTLKATDNISSTESVQLRFVDNNITGFDDADFTALSIPDQVAFGVKVIEGELVELRTKNLDIIKNNTTRPRRLEIGLVEYVLTSETGKARFQILLKDALPQDYEMYQYTDAASFVRLDNVISSDRKSIDITINDRVSAKAAPNDVDDRKNKLRIIAGPGQVSYPTNISATIGSGALHWLWLLMFGGMGLWRVGINSFRFSVNPSKEEA